MPVFVVAVVHGAVVVAVVVYITTVVRDGGRSVDEVVGVGVVGVGTVL